MTTNIANITALRAQSGAAYADGDVVYLRQYQLEGDGGGGHFRYDSAATGSDDGGVRITPADSLGRFLRVAGDSQPLNPYWFGARPGTSVDNTQALARWWAAIGSDLHAVLPNGVWRTSATLSKVASNWSIGVESDFGATLRYFGSTVSAVDFVTIGSNLSDTVNVQLGSFTIDSEVVMAAGSRALWLRRFCRSVVDVNADTQDHVAVGNIRRLWHGIHFDSIDNVAWRGREVQGCQGDGIIVNGMSDIHGNLIGPNAALILDDGYKIGGCLGAGIRCAGGFGGLYLGNGDTINNGENLVVDRSRDVGLNREIVISGGSYDNAQNGSCVRIDEPGLLYFQASGAWFATTAQNNTDVITFQNFGGRAVFSGCRIYNSKRDGIRVNASSGVVLVDGCMVHHNGRQGVGYGVNPNVAAHNVQISGCQFDNNPSGDINLTYAPASSDKGLSTVMDRVQSRSMRSVATPSEEWHFSSQAAANVSIPTGTSYALAPGSGMITLQELGGGAVATFLVGGGGVAKLGETGGGGVFEVGDTATPNRVGVYYDSGAYRIRNRLAAQNFRTGLFCIRDGV